jgi:hypothetical protein
VRVYDVNECWTIRARVQLLADTLEKAVANQIAEPIHVTRQYSSGKSSVVADRSASVIIHSFDLPPISDHVRIRQVSATPSPG